MEALVGKIITQTAIDENGGGGGATNFLALTDTPSSYVNERRRFARVNFDENALEFRGLFFPFSLWIPYPAAGLKPMFTYTPEEMTISQIDAWVNGAITPSMDVNFFYGPDMSLAGTSVFATAQTISSTTTASTFSSFSSDTVPAGNFVWAEITNLSGFVEFAFLNITLEVS